MTNLFTTIQNKYDPYFVGFNRLFDQLADFDANIVNVRKESKYPPYNLSLIHISEHTRPY